jgi:hypothetical protein
VSFLNNGGQYVQAAPHPTARLVRLSESVWVDPVDVAAITETQNGRTWSVSIFLWSGQHLEVINLRADTVGQLLTSDR